MSQKDTSQLVEPLSGTVPFARHASVTVIAEDLSGESALLPEASFLLNHIGSQHAGALFTVGKSASIAAMPEAFADLLPGATPLVRQATIQYRKVARRAMDANARLSRDSAAIHDELKKAGEADFDGLVTLHDGAAIEVATMVAGWSLRSRAN